MFRIVGYRGLHLEVLFCAVDAVSSDGEPVTTSVLQCSEVVTNLTGFDEVLQYVSWVLETNVRIKTE